MLVRTLVSDSGYGDGGGSNRCSKSGEDVEVNHSVEIMLLEFLHGVLYLWFYVLVVLFVVCLFVCRLLCPASLGKFAV